MRLMTLGQQLNIPRFEPRSRPWGGFQFVAAVRAQETGHFGSGLIPPFPPRSAHDFSMAEQVEEPTLSTLETVRNYAQEGGEGGGRGGRAELKSGEQPTDNIIIFKKKQAMSYYTLLPNYYPNCLPQTPYSCPTPLSKSLQLLPILAQALRTSIFQYAATQPAPALNTPSAALPEQKNPLPRTQEAAVGVRSEEMSERNQNLKGEEKENIQQKTAILKGSEEKHNQNSSQHITSEEIHQEEGEVQPAKKLGDLRLPAKKEKARPKKDHFEVPIPTLNLLETADLPAFALTSQEVQRRRESLLQRQVDSWNQKGKNRRDKREIRMLNN